MQMLLWNRPVRADEGQVSRRVSHQAVDQFDRVGFDHWVRCIVAGEELRDHPCLLGELRHVLRPWR